MSGVANIPVLLMVLYHLTGDERWLAEPYAPTRARGLSDHDTGGLPEHVQAEIRDAAEHAVRKWAQGIPPAVGHPLPERLQQMGAVLARAGREMQVIVLTCMPDRYRNVGGAHVVRLG